MWTSLKTTWIRAVLPLLFAVMLIGCAYNPVTDSYEFSMMSRQDQINMGRDAYPKYTQMSDGPVQDKQLQQYVQKLGTQIAKKSHDPDLPFEFNVVNSSAPNAYALPGGFISVTRGLIVEMEQESELAAVLGHEITHSVARHSAESMAWSNLANLVSVGVFATLSVKGNESAGTYAGLTNLAGQGLLASYSRSQESQADKLGMKYMAKAGYDPQGMVDLQKTLLELRGQKPGLLQQLMSSHPLSEERIEAAKPRVKELRSRHSISEQKQLNMFQKRVVEVWKPRTDAYDAYDRGIQLAGEEKYDASVKAFRKAIDRYPDEALFHAWLGRVLLEQGNKQKAEDALARARSLNSDVYRIQLYSGQASFERGNHKQSLQFLKNADNLLPETPPTIFLRGRNYEELQRKNEAAEQYRKYLSTVNEDGPRAKYARKKLQSWGYLQ